MTPREIDALVAEKVFPDSCWITQPDYDGVSRKTVPPFSTDIAAAWEVVEKVKITALIQIKTGEWCARFEDSEWTEADSYYEVRMYKDEHADTYAYAETAPMAIALAALKACGVEVGE